MLPLASNDLFDARSVTAQCLRYERGEFLGKCDALAEVSHGVAHPDRHVAFPERNVRPVHPPRVSAVAQVRQPVESSFFGSKAPHGRDGVIFRAVPHDRDPDDATFERPVIYRDVAATLDWLNGLVLPIWFFL